MDRRTDHEIARYRALDHALNDSTEYAVEPYKPAPPVVWQHRTWPTSGSRPWPYAGTLIAALVSAATITVTGITAAAPATITAVAVAAALTCTAAIAAIEWWLNR